MAIILLLLAIFFVSTIICRFHKNNKTYAKCLNHIPGPLLARYTNVWLALHTHRQNRHIDDKALHALYGPIVRVAPNQVLVSSPDTVKLIYGAATGKALQKGDWYRKLSRPRLTATYSKSYDADVDIYDNRVEILNGGTPAVEATDLFAEPSSNTPKYRLQRRLIGPVYGRKSIQELDPNIETAAKSIVEIMRKMEGMVVDLDTWCHILAIECLGAAVFSDSPGLAAAGTDDGSVKAIRGGWRTSHWTSQISILHRVNRWSFRLTGRFVWGENPLPSPIFAWASKKLSAHFSKKSSAKIKNGGSRVDIISKLLDIHSSNPVFTARWVTDSALSNFGAGTETIGITLSNILYTIIATPDLQSKLHAELDNARYSTSPTNKDLKITQVPYLQATLRESMRLSPVVGVPFPRATPPPGLTISNCFIPAGVNTGINPWVLNRSKEIYGADAEDFKPERWLLMTPEKRKEVARFDLTFGMGARSCLGRHLAEVVLEALLLRILDFEWGFDGLVEGHKRVCTFGVRWADVGVYWKPRGGTALA